MYYNRIDIMIYITASLALISGIWSIGVCIAAWLTFFYLIQLDDKIRRKKDARNRHTNI